MQTILTHLGHIRLYSFVDLILLILAANGEHSWQTLVGAMSLWLGFLYFLEYQHAHEYRSRPNPALWIVLTLVGLYFYQRWEGLVFILLSYLYTQKTKLGWGAFSPFLRGTQSLVITGGITGFTFYLPWLAFGLTIIRNFLGDIRDIKKDAKAGMQTLPIRWGMKQGWKYIHLAGVMVTSLIWWLVGDFSVHYLLAAWIIQIATYNITPR